MYETLLREAEKEQIEVIEIPLHENIKGLYCDGNIALNIHIPTTAEKTCILAEELGHYYTSYGNIIDISNISNRKQEIKARRWAVKRLLPICKIIQAHKAGCRNFYEVAEYLGVTEEFLRHSFKVYNSIYGNFKECGRYVVYFDPPGVLEVRT